MPEKVGSLICDGSQSQVKYFLTPHSLERPDLDERVDSNSLGRILYEDVQGWWWCGCHKPVMVSYKMHLLLSTQIIREPFDYICQVKGKEVRVKLIEVRVQ